MLKPSYRTGRARPFLRSSMFPTPRFLKFLALYYSYLGARWRRWARSRGSGGTRGGRGNPASCSPTSSWWALVTLWPCPARHGWGLSRGAGGGCGKSRWRSDIAAVAVALGAGGQNTRLTTRPERSEIREWSGQCVQVWGREGAATQGRISIAVSGGRLPRSVRKLWIWGHAAGSSPRLGEARAATRSFATNLNVK